MSRAKMTAQIAETAKLVTPFTTMTGKYGPWPRLIDNQTDRQNVMTIIPKEALAALLTQTTGYESATLVPLTWTGSSLFSGAGSHSHSQCQRLRS